MIDNYKSRLLRAIPGGAHTYSRGYDQFPSNAPQIMESGKGVYAYDDKGNRFLDYGMALRAVNIGYAEQDIDNAAFEQIKKGNNLTRASVVELEAAECLIDLIDSVEMVKFTKNGSTAVSAAVKLSRAYTGRTLVARCSDHPFFSYDDWFIASTPIKKGIPVNVLAQTKTFKYNDINSLEKLVSKYPNEIACIVLEPATLEHPAPSFSHPGETFLHDVKRLCEREGIVFILDEMITGFRWHLKGAQKFYNIEADLCTFGKAMANGFSVAAVAGKREIMELGSIEFEGRERLFLLSTTHGAEMSGLGAFLKTFDFLTKHNVIEHIWAYGHKLIELINSKADEHGIGNYFKAGGVPCAPWYSTFDSNGQVSLPLRTLFLQEMIKQGVLMPWIALCYRHDETALHMTGEALDKAFKVYAQAISQNTTEGLLSGDTIKPVFREFN